MRRDARLLPGDLDTRIAVGEPVFAAVGGAAAVFGSFTEASQRARIEGGLVAEQAELAVAP